MLNENSDINWSGTKTKSLYLECTVPYVPQERGIWSTSTLRTFALEEGGFEIFCHMKTVDTSSEASLHPTYQVSKGGNQRIKKEWHKIGLIKIFLNNHF